MWFICFFQTYICSFIISIFRIDRFLIWKCFEYFNFDTEHVLFLLFAFFCLKKKRNNWLMVCLTIEREKYVENFYSLELNRFICQILLLFIFNFASQSVYFNSWNFFFCVCRRLYCNKAKFELLCSDEKQKYWDREH